ncbi:hypothetical protein C447_11525 [Halococcus hamelinensis 100A6]|uniref:Uncharacterized protein n=1 Tax=Halococcus hamelinensis 100A6 TaxID=1132509 RepID=M0M0D6_9EURY|nr:hypothetical protein C447_11525 [Halococcus hamelinensis 100A6]
MYWIITGLIDPPGSIVVFLNDAVLFLSVVGYGLEASRFPTQIDRSFGFIRWFSSIHDFVIAG